MTWQEYKAAGRDDCTGPELPVRPYPRYKFPVDPKTHDLTCCAGYRIVKNKHGGYTHIRCGRVILRSQAYGAHSTAHTKCGRCAPRHRARRRERSIFHHNHAQARTVMLWLLRTMHVA